MAPSFVRLASLLLATPSSNDNVTIFFQVCLSPGCVADGARDTLEKLQALAPPNVNVSGGTCESLCGNGPVVSSESIQAKKVIHRRISGDALLDLLLLGEYTIPPPLLEGYELVSQAQHLFAEKEYESAIPLYKQGIEMALEPAKELLLVDDTTDKEVPQRLQWLVKASRQEAQARLEVGDKDGALISAQRACDVSNNGDAVSLDTLATIYQACNDNVGELTALQEMFALPQDSNMPRDQANRRRTLGFRLAKLEREASQ